MLNSKYIKFEIALKSLDIPFEREFMLKKLMKETTEYKGMQRIDYFINDILAFEVEGGVFTQGRHTRGVGYWNDILKYNAIISAGYPLLRFPSILVKNSPVVCAEFIDKYLKSELTSEFLSEFYKKYKK